MVDHICVVSPGYTLEKSNLQPWVTIRNLTVSLSKRGVRCTILTDQSTGPRPSIRPNPEIITMRASSKTAAWQEYIKKIEKLRPDLTLWPIGPTTPLHRVLTRRIDSILIGYFFGPCNSKSDILRLGPEIVLKECRNIIHPIIQPFIPNWVLSNSMDAIGIDTVVVQSQIGQEFMKKAGITKSVRMEYAKGEDISSFLEMGRCRSFQGDINSLFYGPPLCIRGFDIFVDCAINLLGKIPNSSASALIRRDQGWGTKFQEGRIAEVKSEIERKSLRNRFKIELTEGSFRNRILNEMQSSSIVLFPYRLSQTDMPISIFESLAAGMIVISTDVGALPEILKDRRGIIVDWNELHNLPSMISEMIRDTSALEKISRKGMEWVSNLPSWDEVARDMMQSLRIVGDNV